MSDLSLYADPAQPAATGGVAWDAWAASLAGYGIASYIDRELNRPQMAFDQSQAYFLGNDGTLYQAGRPASNVGLLGLGGGGNGLLWLLLIGGAVYLATAK
jgi:hypothetical protein